MNFPARRGPGRGTAAGRGSGRGPGRGRCCHGGLGEMCVSGECVGEMCACVTAGQVCWIMDEDDEGERIKKSSSIVLLVMDV